ncbi:MAG: hypothetical protein M9894_13025 [Planctomycetes bacterium]|nr:hypothetical protein [Planctomycetota bacterium]
MDTTRPHPPSRRTGLALAALGLLVLLARGAEATSLLAQGLCPYDEGFALLEGVRLASGELPWRDYDPVYGPLEAALLLPFDGLFGPQLLTLRLLRAMAVAGLAVVAAGCALRLGARAAAWLVPLTVAAHSTELTHPVVLPVFASALAADLAGPSLRRGPLVAAGALAGAALLLRLEFGLLALGALAGALALERLQSREGGAPWPALARAAGWAAAGAAPFAGAWAALALAGGPARVLELARATRASMPFRELPYPLLPPASAALSDVVDHLLVFWLPLAAGALAPAALLWRGVRARRGGGAPAPRLALHLALLLLGLLPYATWRPDASHLFPALCAAVTLSAGALGLLERRHLAPRVSRGLGLALAAAVALGLVARTAGALLERAAALEDGSFVSSRLRGLRGVAISARDEADALALLRAVDALAPAPDAPVFVGNAVLHGHQVVPQHACVFINDAFTYVLLGRPIGVRHHCFVPGITTTEATQRELLADLEARDVRVVVLSLTSYPEEPNRSRERDGARLLDRALVATFEKRAEVPPGGAPRWIVLTRRGR